jgi:hypothetical protein
MLWEDQFYETGIAIAERIRDLVAMTDATECMEIAVEARLNMKLRHAPLWIALAMARLPEHKQLVAHTLEAIIERPDELTEFVAMCLKTGMKRTLTRQVKLGLAAAFDKFGDYQLAKYNRDNDVKLRDVAFLCHVKAGSDIALGQRYARLVNKSFYPDRTSGGKDCKGAFEVKKAYKLGDYAPLPTPDTWEVALSGGADKKATFERLISEGTLGGLALLRNLRNMNEAGVDRKLIEFALAGMSTERILPFRFVAAARAVPSLEHLIEPAMLRCLDGREHLSGRTVLLVDVSGSMDDRISDKSDLNRVDAACALAVLARELCEDIEVLTFSDQLMRVPARRGFALRDAIMVSQVHSGTALGAAVAATNAKIPHDRLIVITDEQSRDAVPAPQGEGWMINVASYEHGVGYGAWNRVDGWSESVFDYIVARGEA